jgi:CRP/FNR family transcriptional regulator, cyclic AMP receptor protein
MGKRVEAMPGSQSPGALAGSEAPEDGTRVKARARANGNVDAAELRPEPKANGPSPRAPSRARRPSGQQVAFILAEDPELGEGLPPNVRHAAMELLRARVIVVNRPRWQPPELDPRTTYGLLVLDGLIGRRIRIGRAVSTELLSAGDILRPWEEPCLWNLIPPEVDWRVFRPTRVAILDERITKLICARPELAIAFSGRLYRRARHAEYIMAISHLPKVEHKLLATLWHLASNWGRVTLEGVYIPFRLTHEVLGEILGAKRPSVTTAMTHLQRRGEVAIGAGGGYLLKGNPADWDRIQ